MNIIHKPLLFFDLNQSIDKFYHLFMKLINEIKNAKA
jgi:hypothetical protein